jgi:GT2 family glycosyltransferase
MDYGNRSKPVFSIVLVTYNGLSHTIRCLESLYRNQPSVPWEVIIVDNASSDGTCEWIKEFAKGDHVHGRTNLRLIKSDVNLHFAAANNVGAKVAEGEYLCLLNNDTIVVPGWIEKLCERLNSTPRCGIVGPMSSSSNGRQMVNGAAANYRPDDWRALNAFAEKFSLENAGKWNEAGLLYGWCMFMRKATWDALGGMDSRFIDSYDDNDFCLRAQLAGYRMAIAEDVYIHHHGQATLLSDGSIERYAQNGYENERRLQEKFDKPDQKLVAVMRVANCESTIKEVLDRTARFADAGIIIHLCRSKDNTATICREHPAVRMVKVYDGPFQEDYERNWLLTEALKLQAQGQADWCISVDGDEVYEDKFDGIVKGLMNPRNPHVMTWIMNWKTIWDRDPEGEYYRQDGIFGGFMNYRMFRLIPGQQITSPHPEGHHCGSAPVFPVESIGWTNIRVRHLGYDTPEQRKKKYEFYSKNDNFKNAADIGNSDYHHLIDKTVVLRKWRPKQGISANILCRGEWMWLRGLLRTIEPLVDEFVIIDSGSTDETIPELKRFAARSPVPFKIMQIEWPNHFAQVRNLAKRHSIHPWILALDPDENFEPTDVQIISRLLDEDTEAYLFECINYMEPFNPASGKPPVYATTETVRLFRNIPELYWSGVVHETLEDALLARQYRGSRPVLRSPVRLHHRGYLKSKDVRDKKFAAYEKMNLRQMEVTHGLDPRPYFNMAMHYMNNGDEAKAFEHMELADSLGMPSWRVKGQLGGMKLRQARKYLADALNMIPKDHPVHTQYAGIIEAIDKGPGQFVKV